jgi:hypothetical protein
VCLVLLLLLLLLPPPPSLEWIPSVAGRRREALEILFLLLSAEDNKKESMPIDAGSYC